MSYLSTLCATTEEGECVDFTVSFPSEVAWVNALVDDFDEIRDVAADWLLEERGLHLGCIEVEKSLDSRQQQATDQPDIELEAFDTWI